MPPKPASQSLTHFLCLPLSTASATPQLTASLTRFSEDRAVLKPQSSTNRSTSLHSESSDSSSSSNENGSPKQEAFLPPKAIRPVGTLHLTLGVMSLRESGRVDAALEHLRKLDLGSIYRDAPTKPEATSLVSGASNTFTEEDQIKRLSADTTTPPKAEKITSPKASSLAEESLSTTEILNQEPLMVRLQGLHAMSSPHKTSVLFAEPQDLGNKLYHFCQQLKDEFEQAGFLLEEKRDLKLHATIVNTLYAVERTNKGREGPRGKGRSGGKRRSAPLRFDATKLIERWKDEVWADIKIERIAICEMGAKEDEDGVVRYVEIGSVGL